MLIKCCNATSGAKFLIEKYSQLIKSGADEKNISVIVLNAYKKAKFINLLKTKYPEFNVTGKNIHTFSGLCYNAFKDNWEYIATLINKDGKNTLPNLCGLEISQYIFKKCIKETDFSDYISKINLLHQLFRRYSLIVQNGFNKNEVKERSKIAGETFATAAFQAIEEYKRKTIDYCSFDYLRQYAIFPEIYKNTDYFKDIKYLIVEDSDEYSYLFWQFIDYISPNLSEIYMEFDDKGSSRCGYLCAYKSGVAEYIKKFNPEIISLNENGKFFNFAQTLFVNILNSQKTDISSFKSDNKIKRADMIESVLSDISTLLKTGVSPSEIAVITPLCDDVLKSSLMNNNKFIKFALLSGNEKLIDDPCVKYIISILKAVNQINLKEFELKNLFVNLLKISYLKCLPLIKKYNETKQLKKTDLLNAEAAEKYERLLSVINSLKISNITVSEKIKVIYSNLIKNSSEEINETKYNFLLKEARSFESAFTGEDIERDFVVQIENSVISENPAETEEITKNSVIIATPQKIIDYSLQTKYQYWLDISNCEWQKEDTGTLYNAWILNRDFIEKDFSIENSLILTRDKTARILRKLVLCAKNEIKFYSSLYDNSGNENFGGIADYLKKDDFEKKEFNIIPRTDQKPVLEYNKGKTGIMAVPGAGKTTVLLALIIKLIKNGVKPENIFVLTYMESAAKNFKEKIKSALPDTPELPNISTIHGLALRIIKENANYTKVGLDTDFEICDDIQKERIIKELFFKFKIDDDKTDNYIRCISIVKLSGNSDEPYSKYKEISDFYKFYKEYNKTLKHNNLLDYDDMLYFAVKILEENPKILNYYQNICKYVIEDEAQDSTDIQQKLLELLSGKHGNLVRCGDINQSITSTFTNSNLESFNKFLSENNKIEMNCSQRCAKPIYSFANNLIKKICSDEDLKPAFYNIEMQGTKANPKSDAPPVFELFETQKDEKNYILQKIKEIRANDNNASIAILLRLNSQVEDYSEFFLNNGIKTVIRTDCLEEKKIYKIIYIILKITQNPFDNKLIADMAEYYLKRNLYGMSINDINYIKNSPSPFICETDCSSQGLNQILWDINYWLNFSAPSIDVFALNIGLYYSQNLSEKSNTYLISSFIRKISTNLQNNEEIIKNLEYLSKKSLSAYKFFEEDAKENTPALNIMTVHKSKGDEFDFVFIPQTNEENYPLKKEHAKVKGGSHFVQTIKANIENTTVKGPDILKSELIYETLRLLYVGITRAKKGLFITSSQKSFGNKKHNLEIYSFLKDL